MLKSPPQAHRISAEPSNYAPDRFAPVTLCSRQSVNKDETGSPQLLIEINPRVGPVRHQRHREG